MDYTADVEVCKTGCIACVTQLVCTKLLSKYHSFSQKRLRNPKKSFRIAFKNAFLREFRPKNACKIPFWTIIYHIYHTIYHSPIPLQQRPCDRCDRCDRCFSHSGVLFSVAQDDMPSDWTQYSRLEKLKYIWLFARLLVSLTCGRRYFRSEKHKNFCIFARLLVSLTYGRKYFHSK